MCFPNGGGPVQQAQRTPGSADASVQQRVNTVVNPGSTPPQSVLTTPLGAPSFGKNVSRTVLTGILT